MIEMIRQFLGSPVVLGIWITVVVACVLWTLRDLRQNNAHLPTLMQWVWVLTVAYSGPLGVARLLFLGIRIIWLVCERERWPTNSTHNGLAG